MAYALPLETDERHLVESFRAGEAEAFDSLFRRYSPPLSRFCRGRLVNLSDTEDAVQETLTRACQASLRFRRGAKLWPWLATIAANVCRDINRGRSWLVQDPCIDLTAEAGTDSADPPDEQVARQMARKVRVQIVADALVTLPQQYRSYIHLRDYEDWGYEDIGKFYGASTASVRSTLLRARRMLKQRVRELAEARGQWPLPAFIPVVGWSRVRATFDKWAYSVRNWSATIGTRLAPSTVVEYLSAAPPAVISAAAATVVALGIIAGTFAGATPVAQADVAGAPDSGLFSERVALSDGISDERGTDVSQISEFAKPDASTDSVESSGSTSSDSSASDSVAGGSDSSTGGSGQTTEVEAGSSSIEVSIEPSDDSGSDSGDSIETPEGSASVDPNTENEDPGVYAEPGPAGISCEEPGVVTGAVCSANEAVEDAAGGLPLPTVP